MVIDPEVVTTTQSPAVDGQTLEIVSRFDYLGSIVNIRCNFVDEVKRRLAIGKTSFNRHANILKDRQVPITLRLRLLQTLVFPVRL